MFCVIYEHFFQKNQRCFEMKQGNKLILFLVFLFLAIEALLSLKPTGMVATSVGIINQAEAVMYEYNRNDIIFQIELIPDGNWHSYNGTDGNHAGYDTGNYSDGITQLFSLENTGSATIDVLLASEDLVSGSIYINTDRINGDFQIYIPTVGWKNVPDNNNKDIDGSRDLQELCIANDISVGSNITGFDFRIRGHHAGNYTGLVTLTAYSSDTINPCSTIGSYVFP
jgi:hypothetical protein